VDQADQVDHLTLKANQDQVVTQDPQDMKDQAITQDHQAEDPNHTMNIQALLIPTLIFSKFNQLKLVIL